MPLFLGPARLTVIAALVCVGCSDSDSPEDPDPEQATSGSSGGMQSSSTADTSSTGTASTAMGSSSAAPGTATGNDGGSTSDDDGSSSESGTESTGETIHPTNPDLDRLGSNEWLLLSEGGITFEGHTAYSGGVYDSTNHQFLVFGGGHWDGSRTDVLAFDIATATWTALSETDSSDDHNCDNVSESSPGMLLSSMRPASRHTYDQVEFLGDIGKMLVWSGPTYSGIWQCPGQTLPADTWFFDPITGGWEYRNAAGGPQPSGEAHSGGYDEESGTYYAVQPGAMWSYDVAADTWSAVEPTGSPESTTYTRMITVDTRRRQLWMRPDVYDIASNSWSTSTAEGAPERGLSETYDPENDLIIVHKGTQVFGYSPATDSWEVRDPINPIEDPANSGAGPYGRFFYDPVDRVVLFIDVAAGVWAYRW